MLGRNCKSGKIIVGTCMTIIKQSSVIRFDVNDGRLTDRNGETENGMPVSHLLALPSPLSGLIQQTTIL